MFATATADPPAPAAAPRGGRGRHSFAVKAVLAALLVALADRLLFDAGAGSVVGLYAAALLTALLATRSVILRSRSAIAAAGTALVFAGALLHDPSLLAFALFWTAAAMASLLPGASFDDGWRWAIRIVYQHLAAIFRPLRDLGKLRRARARTGPLGLSRGLLALALPLIGSVVFLALFASANPLIDEAIDRIDLSRPFAGLTLGRLLFWPLAGTAVWSLLRPTLLHLHRRTAALEEIDLPGVSLASVTLSLFAFNAIFALQNGLDIAFLWSGAPLPDGLTLAEYAHRGAYPLIGTALLAALFVLVTLRPGSEMAASALVRRLVYLWIAQNVLLVASTMLRTFDYIEAYSLTRLRISALIWMALVAVGLVLICYRLWRRHSAAWLINANLAAAAIVFTACSFADLGAVAAQWNVRHSREVGGRGTMLDLCYLNRLGASSLLPLIELESRRLHPSLRQRAAWSRNHQMDVLEARQAYWRSWTVRGALRLAEARRLVAERRLPRARAGARSCNGLPPAPVVTVAPAVAVAPPVTAAPALTAAPAR
jgi:hypothetical protein